MNFEGGSGSLHGTAADGAGAGAAGPYRTVRRHGAGDGGRIGLTGQHRHGVHAALYKLLNALTAPLGAPVLLENVLQGQRLRTIFENPNVFAGCAGVAILLALGLAVSTDDKKERCLHLSCLLLNSTAFLLAVSRGAAAAIAAAFLVYLLLERGQRRAVSFVLMVETLVLSGAAALCALPAYAAAGQTMQVLPLLAVLAAAAALCVLDILRAARWHCAWRGG